MRGAGCRLGSGSSQRLFQAVEHSAHSIALFQNFVRSLSNFNSLGQDKARFKFSKTAPCNSEKLEVLTTISSPISFSDIAWHRKRCPSHLGSQLITVFGWKGLRQTVASFGKFHPQFPRIQFAIGLNRHFVPILTNLGPRPHPAPSTLHPC